MGILDSVTGGINRGAESAQRTARSAKLKMDLNDLLKQRKELAAQLGASLYESTKSMPEMRSGREALFDGIAAIDAQRDAIQAEISSLEAQAQASQQAAMTYRCPGCGSNVAATDMFCSGCGKPIAEIVAAATAAAAPIPLAASGMVCTSCGAPVSEGDAFCMSCGTPVTAPAQPQPPETEAFVGTDAASMDPAAHSEEEVVVVGVPEEEQAACAIGAVQDGPAVEEDVAPVPDPAAGSSQDQQPDKPLCPSCGAPVEEGDAFCGACGASVA